MTKSIRFFGKRFILLLFNTLAGRPEDQALQSVRIFLARMIGLRIGVGSQLSEALYIFDGRRFKMGARCRLGAFAKIWDFEEITIGDDLLASHNITLIAGTHRVEDQADIRGPISIGNRVWIGTNVTIIGPVSIGDDAVVGACSLVIKDIPSQAIYAGSPAKLLRYREPTSVPR